MVKPAADVCPCRQSYSLLFPARQQHHQTGNGSYASAGQVPDGIVGGRSGEGFGYARCQRVVFIISEEQKYDAADQQGGAEYFFHSMMGLVGLAPDAACSGFGEVVG